VCDARKRTSTGLIAMLQVIGLQEPAPWWLFALAAAAGAVALIAVSAAGGAIFSAGSIRRRARLPGRGPLSLRVSGCLRIARYLHIGIAEKRGAEHGAVAEHLVVALLLGLESTVVARNVLSEDGRSAVCLRR
jgi:hypothetical protein